MDTYKKLSRPFKTMIDYKFNPYYIPVYSSLKEATEAGNRVMEKPRSPEYDYILGKIKNEIHWYKNYS